MNVIPFPKARARKCAASVLAEWPDGQCGVELEELAQLIYQRGLANGSGCTLEKARYAALEGLKEIGYQPQALRERVRQERIERIGELIVERAQRKGIDLRIEAARTAGYSGDDPLLSRVMAATNRAAKARVARDEK